MGTIIQIGGRKKKKKQATKFSVEQKEAGEWAVWCSKRKLAGALVDFFV
jgi:hypothetical protein